MEKTRSLFKKIRKTKYLHKDKHDKRHRSNRVRMYKEGMALKFKKFIKAFKVTNTNAKI